MPRSSLPVAVAVAVGVAVAVAAGGCMMPQRSEPAPPSPPPADHSEVIQKLRERVAQLELQVRAVRAHAERREQRLSATMVRVEAGLEQLAAVIADSRRPTSTVDPAAVYSVPLGSAPFDGPAVAPVTLVVASEFACPYCERAQATLDQLRSEYGADLKIVYQSFVVHQPLAEAPARALCAAGRLRRHRPMLEALWEEYRQGRAAGDLDQRFTENAMVVLAGSLKLDRKRFERAYAGCAADVARERAHFARLGVSGAPTFFINGRRLEGARPIEQFRDNIEAAKRRAERAIRNGVKRTEYYNYLVATGVETHR